MKDITFNWDNAKNMANTQKHGVSFEEAKSVFFDESALLIADPDHSETEDRFFAPWAQCQTSIITGLSLFRGQ